MPRGLPPTLACVSGSQSGRRPLPVPIFGNLGSLGRSSRCTAACSRCLSASGKGPSRWLGYGRPSQPFHVTIVLLRRRGTHVSEEGRVAMCEGSWARR